MSTDDYVLDNNSNNNNFDDDDEHSTEQIGGEATSPENEDFADAVNSKVEDNNNDHQVVHDHDDDEIDDDHVYLHDDDDDDDDGKDDMLKDVIMWRRRKLSALVLLVTTGIWVLLQLYGFNFVPLASLTLMAFLALLFSYASFLRLLSKEVSYMRSWEMTEQRAKEMGESAKNGIEKGVKWMFNVSCEREWYTFLGVISTLFLLAFMGHYIDLITFLYTGTVVGMTVPIIYAKKEDAIKSYVNKVRDQSRRMFNKFNDKVISKLHVHEKEKKVE